MTNNKKNYLKKNTFYFQYLLQSDINLEQRLFFLIQRRFWETNREKTYYKFPLKYDILLI